MSEPSSSVGSVEMAPEDQRTILVVEDEEGIARYLRRMLDHLGYRVLDVLSRGEDAIAKTESLRPDLVLMDVRLAGKMDGIEAAAAIRERFSVPVVYVTAQSDDGTIERALGTDPFGYLIKPINKTELRCAVEVALHRHRAEAALREREAMLRGLSLLDDLTELYNRRGFLALARQQIHVARRSHQPIALLFLDLDGFKRINDLHGHRMGDQALRNAATVLRRSFRASDVLARIGGDEFAVLLIGATEVTARISMERLRLHLDSFNAASTLPFPIEMSVGMATPIESEGDDVDALLARADAVMYANKRERRGVP